MIEGYLKTVQEVTLQIHLRTSLLYLGSHNILYQNRDLNRPNDPAQKSIKGPYKHGKNGFVTATKLGTTNEFFVAASKNFAAATKRFVDRTKYFVVLTKYFCYPYFNK